MRKQLGIFIVLFGSVFAGFPAAANAQPGGEAAGAPVAKPAGEPAGTSPAGTQKEGARSAPREATPARTSWMIVLGTFRGDDRDTLAQDALKIARTRGIDGAFVEARGPASVVAVGRFSDSTSEEAKRELARVRAVEIDGVRPFAYAFFAPPDAASAMGNRPQYNLVRAREQFGEQARFTLQVAAFGPADLNNPKAGELEQARADAEQAAAILRNEGELAFYYHGRSLSMVTIGVWDDAAFGDRTDPMDDDPTLLSAKKRFPYNIYNGGGVKVKQGKTTKATLQRSQLVRVPDA